MYNTSIQYTYAINSISTMPISVTYHEPRNPNVHQEIKLYKTTIRATPPISSVSAKTISIIYPEP